MLGASSSQIPAEGDSNAGRGRQIDPGLWTIFRVSRGNYIYAPPGARRPGKFICQATSREAAQRACRNHARDERYGAKKAKLPPDTDTANRPPSVPTAGPLSKYFRCGHQRSAENTYRSGKSRKCRKCQLARARERYHESH